MADLNALLSTILVLRQPAAMSIAPHTANPRIYFACIEKISCKLRCKTGHTRQSWMKILKNGRAVTRLIWPCFTVRFHACSTLLMCRSDRLWRFVKREAGENPALSRSGDGNEMLHGASQRTVF